MSRILAKYTRSVAVLAALLLVASCAKKQESTETTTAAESTATPMAPALTDANIIAIVIDADSIDIENGQMAKSMSKNAAVKSFANQMITDHTAVNKQVTDLESKLGVQRQDNDTSIQLVTNANATRDAIKAKTGADFDKAYIDNEVAYHEAVLDMLDKTLIPNAQNAELKAALESVKPAFQAHLDHAKQVQSSLTPQ